MIDLADELFPKLTRPPAIIETGKFAEFSAKKLRLCGH
jgi:hypothetical protein